MLKIHDRQAIVARAGIDFRRRFAHGLGVREDTALNAQQILDGFQVGLPPCLVAFIAQRRRKGCDADALFVAVQTDEHIIGQCFFAVVGAQNIGACHNAHPPQLKFTAELQFIFVDAVDKPHCGLVDGNAVRAAVYTVCDGHPQEHHADAINGHGIGVLIFQPLILRQACQRHAPPQCAFVVGAVQAVLDREPPGKGCAPLDQRVEMMVGRYGFLAQRHIRGDAACIAA